MSTYQFYGVGYLVQPMPKKKVMQPKKIFSTGRDLWVLSSRNTVYRKLERRGLGLTHIVTPGSRSVGSYTRIAEGLNALGLLPDKDLQTFRLEVNKSIEQRERVNRKFQLESDAEFLGIKLTESQKKKLARI